MRISVQPLPCSEKMASTAVVVDVLRATSVISLAVAAGADRIIVCSEIEAAQAIAAQVNASPGPPALLCGERHCQRIPGFDLGNSPQEYTSATVGRRTLVMTTTNGTRAIVAAQQCQLVLAGAFVNLTATANRLKHLDAISIVCAGTDRQVTEEDVLFAGALAHRLMQLHADCQLDQSAVEALNLWQAFLTTGRPLADVLAETRGGRNLVDVGYREDINYCATIDRCDAVPELTTKEPLTLT